MMTTTRRGFVKTSVAITGSAIAAGVLPSPGAAESSAPRPAASLPVSVTAWMRGSAIACSACAAEIMRALNTPRGKPASRKISSSACAHCGTLDACLSTMVLPAISAGAAARKTCQKGKFHGMMASTVPSGRYAI